MSEKVELVLVLINNLDVFAWSPYGVHGFEFHLSLA